jgi:hypothetical protein
MGVTKRQTRREAGTQSQESCADHRIGPSGCRNELRALPAFPISDPKTDLTLYASTVSSRQAASAHYLNL